MQTAATVQRAQAGEPARWMLCLQRRHTLCRRFGLGETDDGLMVLQDAASFKTSQERRPPPTAAHGASREVLRASGFQRRPGLRGLRWMICNDVAWVRTRLDCVHDERELGRFYSLASPVDG
jgi:hypothetical protein